jgi:hypothetical protein
MLSNVAYESNATDPFIASTFASDDIARTYRARANVCSLGLSRLNANMSSSPLLTQNSAAKKCGSYLTADETLLKVAFSCVPSALTIAMIAIEMPKR